MTTPEQHEEAREKTDYFIERLAARGEEVPDEDEQEIYLAELESIERRDYERDECERRVDSLQDDEEYDER